MSDRTSELVDEFRQMMKRLRVSIEKEVNGDWYLVEKKNGRRWIEELSPEARDIVLEWHIEDGNKITPVTIHRKS